MRLVRAAGKARTALRMRATRARALRETDVFVLSFPKSGRTWLTVMVGKALCLQYGCSEEHIPQTLLLTKLIKAERDPRIKITGFGHDRSSTDHALDYRAMFSDKREFGDKGVILLVRDPRDVAVSFYFQVTRRENVFTGSLSEFLRDETLGIRKILAFNKNWYERRNVPRRFQLFTYEEMHENPRRVLSTTLEIMGVTDVPEEIVAQAVEFASFANMRELESRDAFGAASMRPGDPSDPESFKVRRGEIGGYRKYLSADDIAYIESCMREMEYPL